MTCPLCSIAKKQIAAKIVYEDAVCIAFLPTDAATTGQIEVVPKQHFETLEDIQNDIAMQLFYVASYAASAVYEGLASHGTNIICNNGVGASTGHIVLQILPRKENDNISFQWQPKQLSPADFEEAQKKIGDAAEVLGAKKEKRILPEEAEAIDVGEVSGEAPLLKEEKPEEISKEEEENYLVKHLYRIP